MDNMEVTQNLPVGLKTVAASVAAGLFRIFLMPVDTVKVRWVTVEGRGCASNILQDISSHNATTWHLLVIDNNASDG